MKLLKVVLWIIATTLAVLAIVCATNYETAVRNATSFSPLATSIASLLIMIFGSRTLQLTIAGAASAYLTYRLMNWRLSEKISSAYDAGFADGKQEVAREAPSANVPGRVIEAAQPVTKPYLAKGPPNIDQLTYSVREVVSALTATGVLDAQKLGTHLARIKQESPVWSVLAAYNVRNLFVAAAEKARDARQHVNNAAYADSVDFRPGERGQHVNALSTLSEALIKEINMRPVRVPVRFQG